MLRCKECGIPTRNLTQVYCQCGGYVEVMSKKKVQTLGNKLKKKGVKSLAKSKV